MCVEASIEVNNSAPSSPFEAIFGPEGRSLILGPEGHRTSSFGRTKNVRAEVSSTQLHISTQLASAQDTSPNLGFPLSLTFDHEFFSRAAARAPTFLELPKKFGSEIGEKKNQTHPSHDP